MRRRAAASLLALLFPFLPQAAALHVPTNLTSKSDVDLNQYHQVRYVSASTGSDATGTGTLSSPWQSLTQAFSAIDGATSTNRFALLLATGVYRDTNETSFTLEPWMDIYGGFDPADWNVRSITANETILDGENARRVVIASSHTRLDGVTVRNGLAAYGGGIFCESSNPTLSNCTISGNTAWDRGGGVGCYHNSNPTLYNCTISGNTTAWYGGGVDCYYNSNPTLSNCTISGNTAWVGGGVYCYSYSNPTLSNCTISANTAELVGGGVDCYYNSNPTLSNCTVTGNSAGYGGGGVGCYGSSPSLINCTVTGNTARHDGGGVDCYYNSNPTLRNCTISANTAELVGGGVDCYYNSNPTLSNCTVTGNTAGHDGGGVGCSDSDPALINCTISGNSAGYGGGGVGCYGSSPSLINCTISGNTAGFGGGVYCLFDSTLSLDNCIIWNGVDWLWNNLGSTIAVTYSDVQQATVYPGEGNINLDPLFIDPLNHDYRLQPGSPCIDAGDPDFANSVGSWLLALGDFLGRMRIWDGDGDGIAVVDMGAYEFGDPPFVGDIQPDSQIDSMDLFGFQHYWKEAETPLNAPAVDQNGDGFINALDLAILQQVFGTVHE
jgi:parallel beta-helix repeat protein